MEDWRAKEFLLPQHSQVFPTDPKRKTRPSALTFSVSTCTAGPACLFLALSLALSSLTSFIKEQEEESQAFLAFLLSLLSFFFWCRPS